MQLAEKYRPKSLDLVIGQEHVVKALRGMMQRGKIVHMLFAGPPGCGKTSVAHALARELGYAIVEFNASDERGIQTVREKIKRLAFTAGRRIILLDEADMMTEDAQHALRRIMERCSPEVRFILTCNEDWKIIDPIKSRCACFYFRKLSNNEVLRIIATVLKAEGLAKQIDAEMKKTLVSLVRYVDGDARRALNMIDSLVSSGKEVTLANVKLLLPPDHASELLKTAISGDWDGALRMLEDLYVQNRLNATATLRQMYDTIRQLDVEEHVKVKLYEKLGDVERNIKLGCSPLIQLSSFLATAWAARYVPQVVVKPEPARMA